MYLTILVCSLGCQSGHQLPAVIDDESIVQLARFWRIDTEAEISSEFKLVSGEEFYAVLEIDPRPDRPSELNGLDVVDPKLWPCLAVVYPEGTNIYDKNAIRFQIASLYRQSSSERQAPILASLGPQSRSENFHGDLKLAEDSQPKTSSKNVPVTIRDDVSFFPGLTPAQLAEMMSNKTMATEPVLKHQFDTKVVPYWTFLGPTHDAPGAYTFEVLVYPCCVTDAGNLVQQLGPPVSVYKGTVSIESSASTVSDQ